MTFCLTAGEGVWIPHEGWDHREIITEPGSVVFPLAADARLSGSLEPTRFEVPDGWQDWLIQLFNLQVAPLSTHGYSQDGIEALLRRPSARQPQSSHARDAVSSLAFNLPAMPNSRGARTVAEELLRAPALDLTIQEWAARVLSSPSTLLRDFLADTGLTFQEWRLQCRLVTAVDFLAAGYEVSQVAARVGFTSCNGFTRAFKKRFEVTPSELGRRLSAQQNMSDFSRRAAAARRADEFVKMVQKGRVEPDGPGLLPATRTTSHTNGAHVLCWGYRGTGYLDISDRRYEWDKGTAIWIPAGMEHVTGLPQDAISLAIGDANTGQLRLTEPLKAQFSPAWDDYLLFCAVSARSYLRPRDYNPSHILGLFAEQFAAQRALSVPMPTDACARATAMDYLRQIGTLDAVRPMDVTDEVRRVFREQTGMTFARWRYAARMRAARDLILGGAKPSAVARRVGYAHLSTFSAAFSRFHGISPREYQEREMRQEGPAGN